VTNRSIEGRFELDRLLADRSHAVRSHHLAGAGENHAVERRQDRRPQQDAVDDVGGYTRQCDERLLRGGRRVSRWRGNDRWQRWRRARSACGRREAERVARRRPERGLVAHALLQACRFVFDVGCAGRHCLCGGERRRGLAIWRERRPREVGGQQSGTRHDGVGLPGHRSENGRAHLSIAASGSDDGRITVL
jgi:hypothetical protein